MVEAGSTFQWGDAAIGAAAALGLTLASVGGMLTVRRSRHSHAAQIAG